MADRLRDLTDLVLDSLDEPAADGRALADRAHFSRDHLDRLLAAATGESPVGLLRRLLLERAAWQLRTGAATASEAAAAAGYGSLAAFSRAFARAYGEPPSAFAASSRPVPLEAPNGIHFHPPAGLLLPANPGSGTVLARDASKVPDPFLARVVAHHLARCESCWRRRTRCRRRRSRRLTDEEMDVMRTHPEAGVELLRAADLSTLTLSVIRDHHERPDGTGYPSGLKGNAIHEFARFAAVADVYDAVTSKRV